MKELKPQTGATNAGASREKRPGGLNSEVQARIGHQLRSMYDDVVRQGVPDRFAELIRKLDEPAAAAGADTKTEGRD